MSDEGGSVTEGLSTDDSAEWILKRHQRRGDESIVVDARELETSKAERRRTFVLVYGPLLRLLGFGSIAAFIIPAYSLGIADGVPLSSWLPVSVAFGLYPLLCWLAQVSLWERTPVDAHRVLLYVDVVVLALAIYATGASASWFFWLPLVRVADQALTSFKRALLFAHLAVVAYLAVVLWDVQFGGADISWRNEAAKMVALYSTGLYLSAVSLTLEGRRRTFAAAIRLARNTIDELEHESRRLVLSREELRDQVIRDPLTGLLNRKGILEIVDRGLERAISGGIPFSVVLVDLDGFKKINDAFGHAVGDLALRRVANRMLASGRAFDAVGRIGGDEFLIALPNCDGDGALNMAERIRASVSEISMDEREEANVNVRVSLGVATVEAGERWGGRDLIEAADRALYRAKEVGGNCVEPASVQS